MDIRIVKLEMNHKAGVMRIFAYYIENSFAAYTSTMWTEDRFNLFLNSPDIISALIVEDENRLVLGFGLLKKYHPGDAINRTAELTYFLAPECTRKGLGKALLARLTDEAKHVGVDNLVASVSSKNEPSICFHNNNGFVQVGRIRDAGFKFNEDFDIALFQKKI
ncbi:MAG: N-acetyltransferase family protein [bacterium]